MEKPNAVVDVASLNHDKSEDSRRIVRDDLNTFRSNVDVGKEREDFRHAVVERERCDV
jgi:hypothetical protein